MKLEQQVISLPIAKRLKELGVNQRSLFWWYEGNVPPDFKKVGYVLYGEYESADPMVASAFTVAELGEEISKTGNQCLKNVYRSPDGNYHWDYGDDHHMIETSEANMRGSILIHLLGNGLIKLEK